MPIARLTNVTNLDAVLGEIRTLLNSTGDWTIHRDLAAPDEGAAAGGRILVVSQGDCLAGLRSTDTGTGTNKLILFDGVPPYSGTPNLDALPNNSGPAFTDSTYTQTSHSGAKQFEQAFPGPFPRVFIFTNDPSTYCHVAIEVSANRWRHLAFGNLRKFGTWTGGGYYASSYWTVSDIFEDIPSSTAHCVPFDFGSGGGAQQQWTLHYEGSGGVWVAPSQTTVGAVARKQCAGSVRGGFGTAMRSIQETPFSGLIAVVPITLWPVTTVDVPDTIRPAGQIPDMFEINMRNLVPGASYLIGPDEYIVIPVATKGDPAVPLDTENSGYFGYAYKVKP